MKDTVVTAPQISHDPGAAPGSICENRASHRPGRALGRFVTLGMLLFATLLLYSQVVLAVPGDEIGAGTLLFRAGDEKVVAPLLETKVDIAVSGMVARVDVRQRFHNPGSEFAEGVYVFPLPDDSAVDSLKLRIGQRVIVGEIQEKAAARRTYERARERGHRASLVEQNRPNLFTTAVANVAPGETVEVEIAYLQTLRYVQDTFAIRFPMTVTPRYESAAQPQLASIAPVQPLASSAAGCADQAAGAACTQRLEAVQPAIGGNANRAVINVRIDAGFPLSRIESLYHDMDTVKAGDVVLLTPSAGSMPMNRDFELVWQPALGSHPHAAVFGETWKGEDYALIMLMPPAATALHYQPREVIYVIDTSGSMGGTSIAQARDALRFAIGQLAPQDRFNVIRFSSKARALFRQSMPADSSHRDHALAFVKSLSAGGGTEIGKALDLALDPDADRRAAADGYLRQVVFVTDGSVGNEEALFEKISRELGQTRLFTVGIGSAPNDWFMRKAAEFGRGTFTHIGADHMIEERMQALLERIARPALQDIEIDGPAGAEVSPQRIRDLYAGEPVLVRARLAAPGGEFCVSATRAAVPWEQRLSLQNTRHNPGVAALWGRGRIEALMDSLVTGADAASVRADVITLALNHHLVSRYTSLVAVDRTPNRAPGTLMNTAQVRSDRPHGAGYPAGATPATLLLLGGLLTLLASALLGRRL